MINSLASISGSFIHQFLTICFSPRLFLLIFTALSYACNIAVFSLSLNTEGCEVKSANFAFLFCAQYWHAFCLRTSIAD